MGFFDRYERVPKRTTKKKTVTQSTKKENEMTYTTRVRVAKTSEIINLNKSDFNSILNSTVRKGGSGISQLVRSLSKGQGFFMLSEEIKKGHAHIYKAAASVGRSVAVRRGEKDGQEGYWILCVE